jgi:hypothetical protein
MELTRRENDEKVVALNTTMADMMSVLTMSATFIRTNTLRSQQIRLKKVESSKDSGPDGLTIEARLSNLMGAICDSIKRCAKVCDSYQKRGTAGAS